MLSHREGAEVDSDTLNLKRVLIQMRSSICFSEVVCLNLTRGEGNNSDSNITTRAGKDSTRTKTQCSNFSHSSYQFYSS